MVRIAAGRVFQMSGPQTATAAVMVMERSRR